MGKFIYLANIIAADVDFYNIEGNRGLRQNDIMITSIIAGILVMSMVGSMLVGCGANGGKKQASNKNSITVLVESGSPAEALAKETAAEFKEKLAVGIVWHCCFICDCKSSA